MTDTVGPRERALLTQTLVPLIRGLVSKETTVELKNELHVHGTIVAVDCFMNVTMENAKMSTPDGLVSKFTFLFIQTKNIRSVVIPEYLSSTALLKEQVDIATGVKFREERRQAKEKRAKFLRMRERRQMGS